MYQNRHQNDRRDDTPEGNLSRRDDRIDLFALDFIGSIGHHRPRGLRLRRGWHVHISNIDEGECASQRQAGNVERASHQN